MTTTPLPYSYHKGKQQGSVFIFDKDVESDDTEIYQMKCIRSRTKLIKDDIITNPEPQETISHDLSPTDTLHSLAIKYLCKVSDIKRINHIWNANELSARESILIPIVKHSFLLESQLPTTQNTEGVCKGAQDDKSNVDIRTISIKRLGDSADTKMFLERMNRDIETLLKETRERTRKASLSEVKTALTVERIFPEQVSSSGAGLSYFTIGVISFGFCIVFIGLPITLVYWDVVLEGLVHKG